MAFTAYKLFRVINERLSSIIAEGEYRISYPIGKTLYLAETVGMFVFTTEKSAIDYKRHLSRNGLLGVICLPVRTSRSQINNTGIVCADASSPNQLHKFYTAIAAGHKTVAEMRSLYDDLVVIERNEYTFDEHTLLVRSLIIPRDTAEKHLELYNYRLTMDDSVIPMFDDENSDSTENYDDQDNVY